MAEIIGKELAVGLAVEKVRGTAQLTAEKWLKNVETTIALKVEKINRDSSMGIMEDSDAARITKKWVEGELNGVVHADAIGYFLYSLYGTVSSQVVTGSVYDHEFTLLNSTLHPSLTLFSKDGSVQQKVAAGCIINTFEIDVTVDDFVKFSASFLGESESTNSDTVARDTEYDFIAKDVSVKIAATEGALAAATALVCKDVKLTFDKGAIADHVLGAYEPNSIIPVKMSIEGEMTLNFSDTTFKDLYAAETYKYMQIKIEGSQDIGSGNKPTITILLNAVQITGWERAGAPDEIVTQPISFKAFYNGTDEQMSMITVRNLTAEYSTPVSD